MSFGPCRTWTCGGVGAWREPVRERLVLAIAPCPRSWQGRGARRRLVVRAWRVLRRSVCVCACARKAPDWLLALSRAVFGACWRHGTNTKQLLRPRMNTCANIALIRHTRTQPATPLWLSVGTLCDAQPITTLARHAGPMGGGC
jgi:hypothetical protein